MKVAPTHVPVLAAELLALVPVATRVVDGTLGDGGHAKAFRERGAEALGIDRDPEAIARARERLGETGITYLPGNVFDPALLPRIVDFQPDLILLDLGVSSRQLDDEALGFSFRPGVPLDMRMERRGTTGAELLNEAEAADLAAWFDRYADLR